jgi:hypothetical protein
MIRTDEAAEVHVADVGIGVWCRRCGEPAAVEVTWVAVDHSTLEPMARGLHVECTDCGHWEAMPL